ncbi:hypothetical protein PEDI_56710 [Persicobacter diffluens]|uniref:Uncharacterized protein n=1 Tax=Persicobacter diffluens TaxID=981 RepID=A0AAN4W5A4_9BACT|nr:hypothetical protein PEDI_56710 [Persicobacter diffluens]
MSVFKSIPSSRKFELWEAILDNFLTIAILCALSNRVSLLHKQIFAANFDF